MRRSGGTKSNPGRSLAALGMTGAGILAALTCPTPLHAQRAPVLQQIKVRHPYYYREMFIPQATSGPGAATWSPDGSELV